MPLIVRNERQWEPHCQRQWKGGATPAPLQLAQHITTMGGACVVFQAVGMRQSDLHELATNSSAMHVLALQYVLFQDKASVAYECAE